MGRCSLGYFKRKIITPAAVIGEKFSCFILGKDSDVNLNQFRVAKYYYFLLYIDAIVHTFADRKTVPEVGCSSPAISLRMVDLPIPLGPTTEKKGKVKQIST